MGEIDYRNLRDAIRRNGLSQKEVAAMVGISEGQFCQKMSGKYPFKQTEMSKICDVLKIDCAYIADYFFCRKS